MCVDNLVHYNDPTAYYTPEKFAIFKREDNGSRYPNCSGCTRTPFVVIRRLLQALSESLFWENKPESERPIFATKEQYARVLGLVG